MEAEKPCQCSAYCGESCVHRVGDPQPDTKCDDFRQLMMGLRRSASDELSTVHYKIHASSDELNDGVQKTKPLIQNRLSRFWIAGLRASSKKHLHAMDLYFFHGTQFVVSQKYLVLIVGDHLIHVNGYEYDSVYAEGDTHEELVFKLCDYYQNAYKKWSLLEKARIDPTLKNAMSRVIIMNMPSREVEDPKAHELFFAL